MPRIFDNLTDETRLLPTLQETLKLSNKADFCIGYFNLRGWRPLGPYIDQWTDESGPCRILIGMHQPPAEELRNLFNQSQNGATIDNQQALRIKNRLAEDLRHQLTIGQPTNADEQTLRSLASQLRSGKVKVKLFLRHPLHAKLYLLHRTDRINPIIGYSGSSNLTFAGLSGQGELNLDVMDHDSCLKLQDWFEARWTDRLCIDISKELLEIIEQSWARENLIPPHLIYLKMAYHLSHEARAGLNEFRIPRVFGNKMFEFQTAAVKIAAHHINKRGGILLGDVVGLGKTLMATAVARIFQDDHDLDTLIICPKSLVSMWEQYREDYGLRARVLSISRVLSQLPNLRRYRLVIIDESHNLRNREGKRYRAIQEYIQSNESKCILLSATPYNKSYEDLSSQLALFIEPEEPLPIRPETYLKEVTGPGFARQHQTAPNTLNAFNFSTHPEDWRELMRLYMVRRTRNFIQEHYAESEVDPQTGNPRKYLTYEDGNKTYFPERKPQNVPFPIDDHDPNDQYARLYSEKVVDAIENLSLPRYGLANYITGNPATTASTTEQRLIADLSRAGNRLKGFCRTNLFKRLESSGDSFLLSIERHLLRNYVFLHALENNLDIPLGSQDASILDPASDQDIESSIELPEDEDEDLTNEPETDQPTTDGTSKDLSIEALKQRAATAYEKYRTTYQSRFRWLRSDLFTSQLKYNLRVDSARLRKILTDNAEWRPDQDAKLNALYNLVTKQYPDQKVLVFSQFADTVDYLYRQLEHRQVDNLAGVTGNSTNPTAIAHRFSPVSNGRPPGDKNNTDYRVMVATDVLSEGQNLQDCSIIVNYDLPWAIIRLIQRAGRVDRIGQKSPEILCHSFLPAAGVERIIDLRTRLTRRLKENGEVVGTDETFFENEEAQANIIDLYHEKAGILDGQDDEVDLTSHAYQIWQNAIKANPNLAKLVTDLPSVVYSSRNHQPTTEHPHGVLVYMRTAEGNDALAYIDEKGDSITESQSNILAAAQCEPNTPAQPRNTDHHELAAAGVKHIISQEQSIGGQLGRPSGARHRVYTRLQDYASAISGQMFDTQALHNTIQEVYRHPLRQSATDTLNRQLRAGIDNEQLATLAIELHDDDRLTQPSQDQDDTNQDPQIICSLGLFNNQDKN